MSNKLPPLPVGVAPGSGYWNDWYEKLRTLINSFAAGFPFSSITSLPTTLSGYGITDAQKAILVQDEGVGLGTTGTVDTINFTGVGVTASRVGNTVSVAVSGGGGSTVISGMVTVTVPSNSYFHQEVVSLVGCTASMNIVCSIAPHEDTDVNSEEFLSVVALSADPGIDSATINITFSEPTSGAVKINLMAV